MKKISLVSNGGKLLSIIECIFTISLWYCVCFLVDDLNIGAIIFITFVVLFCLFALYISFSNRIIIGKEKLIIIQIRKIEINLKEIIDIYTDDQIFKQNLIFVSTESKTYKFSGYSTLKGWEKNIHNTKLIVNKLNEYIKLKEK